MPSPGDVEAFGHRRRRTKRDGQSRVDQKGFGARRALGIPLVRLDDSGYPTYIYKPIQLPFRYQVVPEKYGTALIACLCQNTREKCGDSHPAINERLKCTRVYKSDVGVLCVAKQNPYHGPGRFYVKTP